MEAVWGEIFYCASPVKNRLIDNPPCTVDQVAWRLGDESVYAFIKIFKRLVSMPPGDFHNQQLLVRQ